MYPFSGSHYFTAQDSTELLFKGGIKIISSLWFHCLCLTGMFPYSNPKNWLKLFPPPLQSPGPYNFHRKDFPAYDMPPQAAILTPLGWLLPPPPLSNLWHGSHYLAIIGWVGIKVEYNECNFYRLISVETCCNRQRDIVIILHFRSCSTWSREIYSHRSSQGYSLLSVHA